LSETSANRALTKRVELLCRHQGIPGASAHDCRHYAATWQAEQGTPLKPLMDMFGWNSTAMAIGYIASAEIANAGTAGFESDPV
jgi:integrase